MKIMRKLRIMGLILLLLGGVSISNKTQAQPGVNISFQTFYEELSPYGRWVRTPQYGSVWVPDAPSGFQPYSTAGYWEVTEYGNTWVSEYDWGWAPFHYGRWSFDDYNGWFWIPGYEWGPAWVNWRSGGGYYGWAPLGPGMQVNISVNLPSFWWVFVPQRYITSPRWHSYCAPRNRVSHYYGRTTIINNYYYNNNRTYAYGPRRDEIERVTRRSVSVREIDMRNRGRVVVAGNSRGNDRYDNSRGYDDRSSRYNDANRRGSTIDAGSSDRSSRGNGRNPGYEANRSDNNSRSNREYEAPTRAQRAPNRDVPDYGSERSSRSERGNEPVNSGGNRESYEVPATRPSRSERGSYEAPAQRESRQERGSYEAPVQRESRSNRGSYEAPAQRESRSNRGSYEAPVQRESRSERSSADRGSYESRGSAPDARSSQGSSERGSRSGGGGASERSSRGPR